MWDIIQTILFSLLLIFLLHCGLNYYNTVFSKKNKNDILEIHSQKYKNIIEDIKENTKALNENELLEYALQEANK